MIELMGFSIGILLGIGGWAAHDAWRDFRWRRRYEASKTTANEVGR